MHTAGPWLQVSKGSGWKGCEALAVVPGSLGQSYLKHEAFREGKNVGSVCFYLTSIHLQNVTIFFDVNSQLIGKLISQLLPKEEEEENERAVLRSVYY